MHCILVDSIFDFDLITSVALTFAKHTLEPLTSTCYDAVCATVTHLEIRPVVACFTLIRNTLTGFFNVQFYTICAVLKLCCAVLNVLWVRNYKEEYYDDEIEVK